MKPITRRKALTVATGATLSAVASVPAKGQPDTLASLIATHSKAEIKFNKASKLCEIAESKHQAWCKTSQPIMVRIAPDTSIDARDGYSAGIEKIQRYLDAGLERLQGMFSGDQLSQAQGSFSLQMDESCNRLDRHCRDIEALPIVAEYNQADKNQTAACNALVACTVAICAYPTSTLPELKTKALWLRDHYQNKSDMDFMQEEQTALLQSFFGLAA